MSTNLEFEVPEDQREAFAGVERGSLRISVELSDVNGDQRVQAPSRARPISDLAAQLGGLGALGGAGGLGSPEDDEPGAPGDDESSVPDPLQSYDDCLDRAAPDDTAALSRCSNLLR